MKPAASPLWFQRVVWWRVHKTVDPPSAGLPSNPRMLCVLSPSLWTSNWTKEKGWTVIFFKGEVMFTVTAALNHTLTFPPEVQQVWAGKPGSPRSHEPEPCCWFYWPSPSAPPRRRAWEDWLWGREGKSTFLKSVFTQLQKMPTTHLPSAEKTKQSCYISNNFFKHFPLSATS